MVTDFDLTLGEGQSGDGECLKNVAALGAEEKLEKPAKVDAKELH